MTITAHKVTQIGNLPVLAQETYFNFVICVLMQSVLCLCQQYYYFCSFCTKTGIMRSIAKYKCELACVAELTLSRN